MSSRFYKEPKAVKRVVITGMSAITPVGGTLTECWKNLINGTSGISEITQFDASKYQTKIAGEVNNFSLSGIASEKDIKRLARFSQLSIKAAIDALTDSGLPTQFDEKDAPKVGCIVGVGMGDLGFIHRTSTVIDTKGPSRVSPFFIPTSIVNMASGQVAIYINAKGPNYSITSACASGAHSIGEASKYIRDDICDLMVVGGSESLITEVAIGGFNSMKALSTRNSDPEAASRPWDQERDGFVMSEGCGMMVLESLERASQRGAKVYAELTGYGASCDSSHITTPHSEGIGASLAMVNAMEDAGVNSEDIGYINAHGTSTPVGDKVETLAIKKAFREPKNLMISSTKSMTGHMLGAAGAAESVFTAMSIYTGVIPPTINLEYPSLDCDLDYTPIVARESEIKHAMNNSFGFGGTNACLVFSKL